MTAKEWRTKFGRELRSTQLYDQQMTRKSHLHSEILKRVKLRHSPSWARKSGGGGGGGVGGKPEEQLFMPPVLS